MACATSGFAACHAHPADEQSTAETTHASPRGKTQTDAAPEFAAAADFTATVNGAATPSPSSASDVVQPHAMTASPIISWPLQHRVMVIDFELFMPANEPWRTLLGWNDPRQLASEYIRAMQAISGGRADYQLVAWRDEARIPVKADGYQYDPAAYLACLSNPSSCHLPDLVDYHRMIDDFDVCRLVETGEVDEVWLFGGPHFGFYESTMVGPDAFWVNSPPLPDKCAKPFIIMGFNYERGLAEMLHDFGHRAESLLEHAFRHATPTELKFRDYTGSNPAQGQSVCGNVHYPPNSTGLEYIYDSQLMVASNCDVFLGHSQTPNALSCANWGCSHEGYMRWWLSRLPAQEGSLGRYHQDWWRYVLDYRNSLFSCAQNRDVQSCDAQLDRCAWYECDKSCRKRGTDPAQVCLPATQHCSAAQSLESCNQMPVEPNSSTSCAWYACANRCLARDTTFEIACPEE